MSLPRGNIYSALRNARNRAVRTMKGARSVAPSASIHSSARVSKDLIAGEYVFIGAQCWIGPKTNIGAYSMLAPRVAVVGGDHVWSLVGTPMQFTGRPEQRDTKIGRDVWIGFGAVISRGVSIGEGAIIGAGAVVTRDVPPFEVWAGVPARRIRDRFNDADQQEHTRRLDAGDFSIVFAPPQEAE